MWTVRRVSRAWKVLSAGVVVATLLVASESLAVRARVTVPNGDRYTGDWLGSDGTQYRIRLDSGQELQLPLDGLVEFQSGVRAFVSSDAVQRLNAALEARELGLENLEEQGIRDAVALAPKYARAHWELARYLEAHQMAGAFDHYVIAAEIDPTSYPISNKIQDAAQEALAAGDYPGAARYLLSFAQSFQDDPYAEQAAYDACEYFWTSLDDNATESLYNRAISALEFATGMFPMSDDVAEGLYRLGFLYERQEIPDRAIAVLDQLLREHPGSPYELEAHLARGYAHLQLGAMGRVRDEAGWVLSATMDPELRERALKLATHVAWTVLTADDGLSHRRVLALYRDGGTLWAGTVEGLTAIDVTSAVPRVSPDRVILGQPTVIRSISADAREIWIGTSGRGILRYDKASGRIVSTFDRLDGLPENRVDAIAMDESDVWAGGIGGLARFDRVTGTWQSFVSEDARSGGYDGGDVTSLSLTRTLLWVGTKEHGVYSYDRATGFWQQYRRRDGLGSDRVTSVAVADGRPFVSWYTEGTTGYSRWVGGVRPWQMESLGPDEIAPEDIRLAYENGSLWVATGLSLLELPPNGEWRGIEYPIALEGARVQAILPDGDYLWVGTDRGVGRVHHTILQPVGTE